MNEIEETDNRTDREKYQAELDELVRKVHESLADLRKERNYA